MPSVRKGVGVTSGPKELVVPRGIQQEDTGASSTGRQAQHARGTHGGREPRARIRGSHPEGEEACTESPVEQSELWSDGEWFSEQDHARGLVAQERERGPCVDGATDWLEDGGGTNRWCVRCVRSLGDVCASRFKIARIIGPSQGLSGCWRTGSCPRHSPCWPLEFLSSLGRFVDVVVQRSLCSRGFSGTSRWSLVAFFLPHPWLSPPLPGWGPKTAPLHPLC